MGAATEASAPEARPPVLAKARPASRNAASRGAAAPSMAGTLSSSPSGQWKRKRSFGPKSFSAWASSIPKLSASGKPQVAKSPTACSGFICLRTGWV